MSAGAPSMPARTETPGSGSPTSLGRVWPSTAMLITPHSVDPYNWVGRRPHLFAKLVDTADGSGAPALTYSRANRVRTGSPPEDHTPYRAGTPTTTSTS